MSHPERCRSSPRARASLVVCSAFFGLAGVAVLALCSACVTARPSVATVTNDAGNPYLDRQVLHDDPSDALRMPGAEALQSVGAERRTTPAGYVPAFEGAIFGTPATPEDVKAFYANSLSALGWQPDTYGVFPTSTDTQVWGWCKPDRLFRIAILDPASLSTTLIRARAYRTLFHATNNGRAHNLTCPGH
jgi:hypothetical protein